MTETIDHSASQVAIGDHVQIVNEVYEEHEALVTAVHGPLCINAVYVSSDPAKRDPYGVQMERLSSLQHESQVATMPHPGRFYRKIA